MAQASTFQIIIIISSSPCHGSSLNFYDNNNGLSHESDSSLNEINNNGGGSSHDKGSSLNLKKNIEARALASSSLISNLFS